MRLIDADKVKIESRKHCIDCNLNGTKHCKTCVINLICDRLDLQPTAEDIINAKDFKRRINNMEYVYIQDCAEDVIDAIDCEVTYFKEKQNNGTR